MDRNNPRRSGEEGAAMDQTSKEKLLAELRQQQCKELREIIEAAKVTEHAPNGEELATYACRDKAAHE